MHDTLKDKKTLWSKTKCFCTGNVPVIVAAVGIILLIIGELFLYKNLHTIRGQLARCRSNCSK